MQFHEHQKESARIAKAHGFWDVDPHDSATVDRKLMLIVGEIAEAQEDWRDRGLGAIQEPMYTLHGKPEGFGVELADAVIRIMDLCEQLGIDLEACIIEKNKYNEKRPFKHGKLF